LTEVESGGDGSRVIRAPHENAATVLVDPAVLRELELHLMGLDLRLWPIATSPVSADGPREAFQVRRRMVEGKRGAWDDAADWTPVWISFGEDWYFGAEPLPWAAHRTLWQTLERYGEHVRYQRRLGGIPRVDVLHEQAPKPQDW
jgi:hypothetical protein